MPIDFQRALVMRFWQLARCRPVAGYAMYLDVLEGRSVLAIDCRADSAAHKLWEQRAQLNQAACQLGIERLVLRVRGEIWRSPWQATATDSQ